MSTCLRGRTATIALRKPRTPARNVKVVFPARWGKATLLRYVRDEHPGETVRIVRWDRSVPQGSWEPFLWICNPEGFADYDRGLPARSENER